MCSQRRDTGTKGKLAAYLAVPRQVDFEGLGVVFEAQRRHGEENILAVYRLALLLLAFFGGWRQGISGCLAVAQGGTDLRW